MVKQWIQEHVMPGLASWLAGPSASLNPWDDRYYESTAGYPSRAGMNISADSARKVAAVYRCVSILANTLAMLPKGIYENLERGRREAKDHPLHPLISFRPNQRQTAFEFWRQVAHHLVLRQNAFIQIVPGGSGRGWVGQLVPLHPDRVHGPTELPDGSLRYEYQRPNGERVRLLGGLDMWHLQGLSEDGLRGLSMMELASDSLGLSLAAEHHAARFFERGVKPTGILQSDHKHTQEVADAMGDSFGRRFGGEDGQGRVPVLWEGVKFQPVSLNLKDQEFLDSRKFSVAEIARWFGVPPHMIGDVERSTSWGTGIEQQGLGFLIYSLQPWMELLEQSIRFTLIVQAEKYYAKINGNAVLRMDADTQATVFGKLIDKGILNPNECRELLERNPREGGDEYVNPGKAAAPPMLPEPEPEPEPEADDEKSNAGPRASNMARTLMNEFLGEEENALELAATRHRPGSKAWRSSIVGFYGRFARRIAETGFCARESAKVWCSLRRDAVIRSGELIKLDLPASAVDEALLEDRDAN